MNEVNNSFTNGVPLACSMIDLAKQMSSNQANKEITYTEKILEYGNNNLKYAFENPNHTAEDINTICAHNKEMAESLKPEQGIDVDSFILGGIVGGVVGVGVLGFVYLANNNQR